MSMAKWPSQGYKVSYKNPGGRGQSPETTICYSFESLKGEVALTVDGY